MSKLFVHNFSISLDGSASKWGLGIGADIMGGNKFGPQRGPWSDDEWRGWWGDSPAYHTPFFILTHHIRPTIEMDGGTTFHFDRHELSQRLRRSAKGGGRRGHSYRRRSLNRPNTRGASCSYPHFVVVAAKDTNR
jgi:hypothetical protein